jgi:hypothetical protein
VREQAVTRDRIVRPHVVSRNAILRVAEVAASEYLAPGRLIFVRDMGASYSHSRRGGKRQGDGSDGASYSQEKENFSSKGPPESHSPRSQF